jgi:hypothetical protein
MCKVDLPQLLGGTWKEEDVFAVEEGVCASWFLGFRGKVEPTAEAGNITVV